MKQQCYAEQLKLMRDTFSASKIASVSLESMAANDPHLNALDGDASDDEDEDRSNGFFKTCAHPSTIT